MALMEILQILCLVLVDHEPCSAPQVRISVHSGLCHADSLNLEVVSTRAHGEAAAPQQQQQVAPQGHSLQLVQEVVRQAEEAQQQQAAARRPKLSREEREFSQSKAPNLYSLLEEVRELALLDLESTARLCTAAV